MEKRRVLESWKAIASYLGRTEKTCRKWERELGLPIHRLDDSVKAHVFAYEDELDRWKEEKLQAERVRKADRLSRLFGLSALSRQAKLWLLSVTSLLVLVIAGLLVRQFTLRGFLLGGQAVKGVAILPFDDLSQNKEYEYFCSGMVEALIDALGKIEGLRVPARTSSFYFKDKNASLQEIGKKLNVDYVLRTSLQVEGDKMRIIPQLVKVADGYVIWSDKYDRIREDVFTVEDDIARKVADSLEVRLTGEKLTPLVNPGTANLEAYNLYLQGRYLWSKRGFENLLRAVDYFQKAIDLDPSYALGYAGISMAYFVLGDNCNLAPHEVFPKARAYALKALELDDGLAEAHYSLGGIKQDYDWDFAGAEREYKKALKINPRDAYVHQAYAFLLKDLGRHDEAIKEIRLARELDPLALRVRANVGYLLYFARKYDEAEQELKRELEFEPNSCIIYMDLGYLYREMGRYEEALDYNIKKYYECYHLDQTANFASVNWRSAYIYARMGKKKESLKILEDNEHPGPYGQYGSRVSLAGAFGWMGDKDKAFSLLEKAYEERDARMTYLKADPWLDCLRDDPRFADLVRRVGLEK